MSGPERIEGEFAHSLLTFCRLLRGAGLRVSTKQVTDLALGLTHIDLARQEDVCHAMRCFLVHSPEERVLFDRLFDLYWLHRLAFEFGTQVEPATIRERPTSQPNSESATGRERSAAVTEPPPSEPPGVSERSLLPTYSPFELLRQKDFAAYTEQEQQAAQQFIRSLLWRFDQRTTRRRVRTAKQTAYPDLRRAIQKSIRRRGEIVELAWRRRKRKPRPLVVICDISGSMERYSRLFLYMMFALVQGSLVQGAERIETFVFGTRLTRITPALRHDNLDVALSRTAKGVVDWSGGTRIGESLRTFNYVWARRVLGHGAVVLIISDGWDRGDRVLLDREIRRLRRQTPRLIWLNPLAGKPDYQPLVRGIETILPHVDEFLPLHNLDTVTQLAGKLGTIRTASPNLRG